MPVRRLLLPVVLLAAAACGTEEYSNPPPLDRFVFPTGLAMHRLPSGTNVLLVVSSNVDLLYDPNAGGTVISLDPTADPPRRLGAVTIPSFGGTLAVADEESCPGVPAVQALVASRYARTLITPDVGTAGELSCGPACVHALAPGIYDPFDVTVACLGSRRRAFVGYLDVVAGFGTLTQLDLDDGSLLHVGGLAGAPYAAAYDAERDRLWVTEQKVLSAPLQALELSSGCQAGAGNCYAPRKYDLWPQLRGADLRGIALSNPQAGLSRRAYVAARVYDADAASSGFRPSYDVGAVLFVLDLAEGSDGAVPDPIPVVRMVPLGLGASQVRVLPARAGLRDLVAVTSTTEGLLTLYDDEVGAVARVFALAQEPGAPENPLGVSLGTPLVGRQPFGLAVEARGGRDWIYVSSFGSGKVTAISLDPSDPSGARIEWAVREVNP